MTVRTNLITNPSFETGSGTATGWTVVETLTGSPTLTQPSDPLATLGQSKAQQMVYAATSDVGTTFQFHFLTDAGTFAETENAYFSVYLKKGASEAGSYNVAVSIWARTSVDGAINVQATSNFHASLTTSYQRFSIAYPNLPATTSRVRCGLYVSSVDSASGDVIDLVADCALLEKSASLGDYFDGETTDTGSHTYAWTGTANASTSTDTDAGFTGLTVSRTLNG